MTIITRFAPSPSGFLHIGNARTALFNWLFAQKTKGKFLLRIEDTDKERSTPEAINAIIASLEWMGLNWDEEIIYQSKRSARHAEVANHLLRIGKAYKCYSTIEEIEDFRSKNPHEKFISPWRDRDNSPSEQPYVIRLKADHSGQTTVYDAVKGEVSINNTELDDMILLRSDGSPTYMLAVVVDDHDMGVNHVIRGDDHFTNTFRQLQIINSLGWPVPVYAHLPLIHGMDGGKLSKRHGALGVMAYEEMGYLAAALNNYLLRLGWSYGDEEIIPMHRAKEIFTLDNLGKSSAKFDIEKLKALNAHYINETDNEVLLSQIYNLPNQIIKDRILMGMDALKVRAKTILELAEVSKIYISKRSPADEKANNILQQDGIDILNKLYPLLQGLDSWQQSQLEELCKAFALESGLKVAQVMSSLRAGVLGTFDAPSIIDVMIILGKEEVLERIKITFNEYQL